MCRQCFFRKSGFFLATLILSSGMVSAQGSQDTLLGLRDAVKMAEMRNPGLNARRFEADASVKATEIVRYSRNPTIEASYQANISTANNLTGQFNPFGILPITGPPSTGNNYSPATGSAAALLLNWQAVTFGERKARIGLSDETSQVQAAGLRSQIFQEKIAIISLYLDLLLAYDVVSIREENILRVKENLRQSVELTTTGIKPGLDSALFLSELSSARIDLLNAKKDLQSLQFRVAGVILTDKFPVPVDSAFLRVIPFDSVSRGGLPAEHPDILLARQELHLNQSKEKWLRKTALPVLSFWGTAFGRGTGFEADGTRKTWDGMELSRYNYGTGIQLSFPIMKYGEVKRQLKEQSLLSRAAEARLTDRENTLRTTGRVNENVFQNSLVIAKASNDQLTAAQYAFDAMQTRYGTGLVNFADLIQAQYGLVKAQLDLKRTYWDCWKSLLLQAAVNGDENIFLQQIR